MLFLLILGWSLLRSLGCSDGANRRATCNLHKKGDLAGGGGVMPIAAMAKSVSSL